MIPFNRPAKLDTTLEFISNAMNSGHLSGDGEYSKKCHAWFQSLYYGVRCLLTPSATHALELAALLIDIQPGDEVIVPSYTFVSSANPFVLRGAKIKFVDVCRQNLNSSIEHIRPAITDRTKAVVCVNYAGTSTDLKSLAELCKSKGIILIEDNAQGFMATYDGRQLGSFGDLSVLSFHETKNITSGGEGGLLVINNPIFQERAAVIREKGTDRTRFFQGLVDKYTWQDVGSSFLPSELQAAYLFSLLNEVDLINKKRLFNWSCYNAELTNFLINLGMSVMKTHENGKHNGHIYYIIMRSENERAKFIKYMKSQGVNTPFHYHPLHSSPAGQRFGQLVGNDDNTTFMSQRLVRLPIYFDLSEAEQEHVISHTKKFFTNQ
jgi:dTDP-4-amino-4,6-dideoxygalactose transaminase